MFVSINTSIAVLNDVMVCVQYAAFTMYIDCSQHFVLIYTQMNLSDYITNKF